MKKPAIFLVGPTASGKSEIAVKLAKKLKAEIISCDSMQIYKDMNIGTSKPSRTAREEILHHLIDAVSPDEEFNVAKFQDKAVSLIKKIHNRGKVPFLVGGSGLYMKVLLDGIFKESSKDEKLRERLKKEIEAKGSNQFYQKLKKVDPEAAKIIHPKNTRRIIRALEVYYSLGKPISEVKRESEGIYNKYKVRILGITRDRKELYERINKRVDLMFDKGLVDEVRRLNEKYNLSDTAREALGYKEILKELNNEYSLDEAKRLIKRNTRRYAKRQLTWFRKESRIEWIEVKHKERAGDVANRIYRMIKDEI